MTFAAPFMAHSNSYYEQCIGRAAPSYVRWLTQQRTFVMKMGRLPPPKGSHCSPLSGVNRIWYVAGEMSAFGPKQTSLVAPHMSALGGKADMARKYSQYPLKTQNGPLSSS